MKHKNATVLRSLNYNDVSQEGVFVTSLETYNNYLVI